ncbi:hypothetical protein COB87_003130 [Candidatus Wolfebacteria bacterium]|nr:hypothetical protein [Candidatus Wolfebacteria bacterium]
MYLFLIFFTLTTLFVGMVWFERKRDQKFLEKRRAQFDMFMREQEEIFSSLDIIQALEYIMRYLALQISHGVIAFLHFMARRSELFLRKARRKINAAKPPQEEPSHFVKAMREAKEE